LNYWRRLGHLNSSGQFVVKSVKFTGLIMASAILKNAPRYRLYS
jgi:hypothetical protein